MPIIIPTPRLELREFAPEDAPRLQKICNQEHVLRWLPSWRTGLKDCETWIGWMRLHYKKAGARPSRFLGRTRRKPEPPRVLLAAVSRETEELVGLVGVSAGPGSGDLPELTCLVTEELLHRGYGREMVEAFCAWAFQSLPLDRIFAAADPANHPACALLEGCGFVKVGFLKRPDSGGEERLHFQYRLDPPPDLCGKI